MPKAIVVLSGGLDSTTVLHHVIKELKYDVEAITFHYGQRHEKEIKCAKYQASLFNIPHHFCDISFLSKLKTSALVGKSVDVPTLLTVLGDPQPTTYVPNRNMIFLAIAASIAEDIGAENIFYGPQQLDNHQYWDTTDDFREGMNHVLSLNRRHEITIVAPLVYLAKTEVVELGLRLGVDYSNTWSCYQGEDICCGICATCCERRKAFKNLCMDDPLPYKTPFEWDPAKDESWTAISIKDSRIP